MKVWWDERERERERERESMEKHDSMSSKIQRLQKSKYFQTITTYSLHRHFVSVQRLKKMWFSVNSPFPTMFLKRFLLGLFGKKLNYTD